jgi:hypothetical protein
MNKLYKFEVEILMDDSHTEEKTEGRKKKQITAYG